MEELRSRFKKIAQVNGKGKKATSKTPGNASQQPLGVAGAAAAEPPNNELQNPTDNEIATGGFVAESGGNADSQSSDGAFLSSAAGDGTSVEDAQDPIPAVPPNEEQHSTTDGTTGLPIQEEGPTTSTGVGDSTANGTTGQQMETASENYEDFPVGKQLVSKAVRDNTGLLEKISKSLDREHRVVQCWKHLAHVLDVPAEETRTIDHFTEHSPTEDMFNYLVDIWRPELKVEELKEKLRNVHRNDIIESLVKDGFRDDMSVVDLINENPAFIALLSSKLDTETIGNWESLATQFKIKKQKTEQFGLRGFGPTGALFLHMQTTEGLRDMTMGELHEHFKGMERPDLVNILEKYEFKETDSRLVIKEVVQGSELLAEIGERLNKEITAVKNWCYLAYRMKIPPDVYSTFDTSKTEAKSPTKMMFDWLAQCKPGLQVDDLLEGLKKINRIDVVDLVTKEGSNC